MALSTREIQAVIEDLRPLVTGATVREVAQMDRERFVFRLRAERDSHLLVCVEPGLSRLHLLSAWPAPPRSRHPFFLFLKRHLAGARLEAIEQLQDDRIVEFCFAGEESLSLVAELTGKLTNLVCVSKDGEILEALRHVRLRDRQIFPHQAYSLPPVPQASSEVSQADRFADSPDRSAAIEAAYRILEQEAHERQLRAELDVLLREVEKKAVRKVLTLTRTLASIEKAEHDRLKGELLKAHLGEVPHGARRMELPGADGQTVEIALDPRLSPAENMQRYFRRYKDATAALEHTRQRLDDARCEEIQLERFRQELESAPDVFALEVLRRAMAKAGLVHAPTRRGAQTPRSQPRRFVSADGFEILVGRNNQQNDHLTLHLARGNDLWLHTQTIPGSHVIVRTPPGKTVSKETLLDAAQLAVYYSNARQAKSVFVDYVQRKFVRKPKGSPAGCVTFAHNKTLLVEPDPERLRRILASGGPDKAD